jgi:hypothetical protein
MPVTRTLHIYVSKYVRIRDYFSKPKGAREQKKKVREAPHGAI